MASVPVLTLVSTLLVKYTTMEPLDVLAVEYRPGAAKAVSLVLPELAGKLNGFAMRVPTPDVSITDLTVNLSRDTTAEEINAVLKEASEGPLKGILGYTELPQVSKDFQDDPRSSIIDGLSTMVINKRLAKVVSWYDNEWGYSNRIVDLAVYMAKKGQ